MADFQKLLQEIKDQAIAVAKDQLNEYLSEAKLDVESFIVKVQTKLESWTKSLLEGKMDADEFGFLLKSQRDLTELNTLKAKGLAQVRIDKFKNALLDVTLNAVLKFVKF